MYIKQVGYKNEGHLPEVDLYLFGNKGPKKISPM